jgi:hypothetical protein
MSSPDDMSMDNHGGLCRLEKAPILLPERSLAILPVEPSHSK